MERDKIKIVLLDPEMVSDHHLFKSQQNHLIVFITSWLEPHLISQKSLESYGSNTQVVSFNSPKDPVHVFRTNRTRVGLSQFQKTCIGKVQLGINPRNFIWWMHSMVFKQACISSFGPSLYYDSYINRKNGGTWYYILNYKHLYRDLKNACKIYKGESHTNKLTVVYFTRVFNRPHAVLIRSEVLMIAHLIISFDHGSFKRFLLKESNN